MAQETILVVDDEPVIRHVIRERLEREGFQVRVAAAGGEALREIESTRPDLMILDLMLPDLDGLDVLRQVRRREGSLDIQGLPVIILTARDDDIDVVVGLELGADDYVVKPFNPRELVARVRAVLRRRTEALALAGQVAALEARLQLAGDGTARDGATRDGLSPRGLHLDEAARRAWIDGQLLDLRPREYDLLSFLVRHPGQVLTREVLLDAVWGTSEFIDDRTVDVHVHRLRQKLAAAAPDRDPIQTERGVGYRFE
ncbi:MAG: response regulator transcription factor [Anaerolineae bacterium]|nr:response regulator transcription factor [Anaerolineae bacterium]